MDDPNEPGHTPDAAEVSTAGTERRVKRRVRTVLSVTVGAVAIIGLLASVLGLWAREVLFDSTSVSSAVDKALQEEDVTAGLANRITDQAFLAADVRGRLAESLPPALERLTPALVGGAHAAVQNQVEKLLAQDVTRAVVVGLVEQSHQRLLKLLEGDGLVDGITIIDGEVSVNLLPLVTVGLTAVQDLGFADDLEIPALAIDGDPAQQQAELESVLGRELPDEFGQLVVYRSDALDAAGETIANAQRAVVLVKRTITQLVVLTVLCLVGSVLLANRRWRAVLALSLAAAGVMIIARSIIDRVIEKAPGLAVNPGARTAIRTSTAELTSGLHTAATLVAIVGIVVAVVVHLGGPSASARRVRGAADSVGGGLRSAVDQHRDATALVSFAMAVAVLGLAGLGLAQLVIALLFAAGGAWAMWAPGRVDPSTSVS